MGADALIGHDSGVIFDTELGLRALRVRQGLNEIAARSAQRFHPEYGECFWQSEPASAAFCGDSSPLTQACGVGFHPDAIEERLQGIFEFYGSRSRKWELILTPFEPASTFNLAIGRGLRVDHHESVLFRDLGDLVLDSPLPAGMAIEPLDPDRYDEWSLTAIDAFMGPEPPDFAVDMMAILNGSPADRYAGIADGKIVAVGSSVSFEDTVFLGGMGTLEAYRGRGFQSAMVARRLADAQAKGAKWAMIETVPGTGSQRNAMRAGFRVAYTAGVWVYEVTA